MTPAIFCVPLFTSLLDYAQRTMPDLPPEETLLLVDPDLDFLDWATKHLAADGLRILRFSASTMGLGNMGVLYICQHIARLRRLRVLHLDLARNHFDGTGAAYVTELVAGLASPAPAPAPPVQPTTGVAAVVDHRGASLRSFYLDGEPLWPAMVKRTTS